MAQFVVSVEVVPRRGLLDPQGKAVSDALHALGFGSVSRVAIGRHLVIDVDAASDAEARAAVQRMCEQLLANPVTEDFHISAVSPA
jgi:phosphoribosylformylglycinamidine synthase